MNVDSIFLLQFLLSLVAWTLVVGLLLRPSLARLSRNDFLIWLTVPHAFRHVGMVFLVPGVVAQPLPGAFAVPAAYGDLTAGLLALLAIVALRRGWSIATGVVWVFSVVGLADLANALRHVEVVPDFGATWYIPTLVVPMLLVTHAMILIRLLSSRAPRAWANEWPGRPQPH